MPENAPNSPETLRAVFDDLRPGSSNIDMADAATVEREAKKESAVEWKAASSVIPEIAKLLDIPLPGLLVGFWQKADEVAAKREESKASPEKKFEVSFRDSKTEATFDPSIEVRFNGVRAGKPIPFKIVLPLTFKSVVLTIKNGEIIDTAAGQCSIEGSIKLGSVTVAKLRKPVTLTIAPGLLAGHATGTGAP